MDFKKKKVRDLYLYDTPVENIFINEYLPQAKGDYVKVYMYGYMHAHFDIKLDEEAISKQLGLSRAKVSEAWSYWEEIGAVKRHYVQGDKVEPVIEFLSIKDLMYATLEEEAREDKISEKDFNDNNLKEIFRQIEKLMERQLSSTEILNFNDMLTEEHIAAELIFYGIEYCKGKGKDSLKYIQTVVRNWAIKGFSKVSEVKEYMEENDRRHLQYRRILQAFGFTRNATEQEKQMMDRWLDIMGYTMDTIVEAVGKTAGISTPNFNYVNKVLENWKKDSEKKGIKDVNSRVTVTEAQLNDYYRYILEKDKAEAEKRTKEIYAKIPRVKEIDNKLNDIRRKLVQNMLEGKDYNSKDANEEKTDLEVERAGLLTDMDYEMDYTDVRYLCEICRDTGQTDLGEVCACRVERMKEAEDWIKQKDI